MDDRDQTENQLRFDKETAEAANQAKSNFLAVVSHELRTPLNAVLGAAEMMLLDKKEPLGSQQYLRARSIKEGGEHLLLLVNDILDFSKLAAKKMVLVSVPFDLQKTVKESASTVVHLFDDKPNLVFKLNHLDVLPHMVLGDELRLKQVLINLLGNAIKFTDRGEISLETEIVSQSDTNVKILVRVSDTGIGIPNDQLENIFEKFTQVESGYARRYQGTGLGLAICQSIVELMGGVIHVSSEVAKGSCFSFEVEFPLAAPQLVETPKVETQVPIVGITAHILVVEDVQLNRLIVADMLDMLGCTFDMAETGNQALELFEHEQYDIIFCDMGLPDIDGTEVMRNIRKRSDAKATIPIVAVTGHILPEDQQNFLDAGANLVLIKPMTFEQLEQAIRDQLHQIA